MPYFPTMTSHSPASHHHRDRTEDNEGTFAVPLTQTLLLFNSRSTHTHTHTQLSLPFFPQTQPHTHDMPRNGDGSSDNGPIEGQEVVHGTSGDVSSRTSSLSSSLFQFQIALLLTNLITDHPPARQEQRRADAGDREGRRYDPTTTSRRGNLGM
jgi:hypothetical protein